METYVDFWDESILARLTPQQMIFVRAYIETDDMNEAAKTAWPESRNPRSNGMQAMASYKVRAAIARARATIIDYVGMNRAAIVRELESLARFNVRDYFGPDGQPLRIQDLSEEKARALGDVEFAVAEDGTVMIGKVKSTKIEALKILAKSTGMLDKGSNEPPTVYNIDLSFAAEDPAKGVKVKAGNTVIDIKTTNG